MRYPKKVLMIRAIARELREERGRDPSYAMRAARRYVRRFPHASVI